MMLKLGVHIKLVSETLGHSRVDLTLNTYSHLAPGLQDDATAKLNTALYGVQAVNASNTVNKVDSVNTVNEREHVNTRERIA